MKLHSTSNYLLSLLLCTLPSQYAQGESAADDLEEQYKNPASYMERIEELESGGGAYSPELAEALSDYGHALRAQGKYQEAVSLFKRATHLARINQGLNNPAQIPLLQGEIASYIGAGNYQLADQRQKYLLNVQLKSLEDANSMADAMMQQADWQLTAYRLQLGEQPQRRLEQMLAMYQHALTQLSLEEGEDSPALVPALKGLIKTHYMIADFEYSAPSDPLAIDTFQNRQPFDYASTVKSANYQRGQTAITHLYNIKSGQLAEDEMDAETAATLAMLGDWHLYHGRRELAFDTYKAAYQELEETDAAKANIATLFGDPVALPDVAGIKHLRPAETPNDAAILVEFSVDIRGRAFDIKRLDTNEALDSSAKRLMRALRRTKFRPRIQAGQAVETTQIVQAFNIS